MGRARNEQGGASGARDRIPGASGFTISARFLQMIPADMRLSSLVPLVLVASSALTAAALPCVAGPIDARELAAREDFAAGRYGPAVDTFSELFSETGDTIFLRNIARCYQKLKKPDEAIANFQAYLAKGKISPDERAEIDSYIADMQRLKRQSAVSAAPATAPARAEAAPAPIAVLPTPPAGPTAITGSPSATALPTGAGEPSRPMLAPDATAPTARTWKVVALVTTIAGVALVGTGVAFGVATRSAASDVSGRWDQQRDSAGRRDETLQWVAYGVGGAALAAGALLFVYGPRREAPSTKVRVDAALWPPALRMEARF